MAFTPPKKGERRGGRQKGTPNKRTAAQTEALASGITPLEYMLSVLRDEDEPDNVRLDAAKAAAPYVHSRLSSIEANIKGKMGVTVEIVRLS